MVSPTVPGRTTRVRARPHYSLPDGTTVYEVLSDHVPRLPRREGQSTKSAALEDAHRGAAYLASAGHTQLARVEEVIGRGSTGGATRHGDEVHKNATQGEIDTYKALEGITGVSRSRHEAGKIITLYYKNGICLSLRSL